MVALMNSEWRMVMVMRFILNYLADCYKFSLTNQKKCG
ncbi:hypothetical protein PRUB_a1216 [Pseudoalteromonas rubra]|uniref:Uncharacterized protein n=1 Tax=Pseudoalteromonas rubra TaxID=43658 RepID=A0A8T0C7E9_9GAMM|nr:hypothetical protein PRUB_a1216 [Pseudoalteromonas rubra]